MCLNVVRYLPRLWHLQDARPPFDIHEYGERVLDKLSTEGEGKDALSFGEVVKGQRKHDVARTFSALLQLVKTFLWRVQSVIFRQQRSFYYKIRISCTFSQFLISIFRYRWTMGMLIWWKAARRLAIQTKIHSMYDCWRMKGKRESSSSQQKREPSLL